VLTETPAIGRWKKEDLKFKASLGYVVRPHTIIVQDGRLQILVEIIYISDNRSKVVGFKMSVISVLFIYPIW
jgi:hypothetical protein